MTKLPVAAPHTEGRTFGTDWSIANVARLLLSNAARGAWHDPGPTGGSLAKVNQNYLRTVSARHLPTGVSLIFMRLEDGSWYASLCFAAAEDCLPWNDEVGERWLRALFGEDRVRLLEDVLAASHQFTLPALPRK